jgi:hypothetical protein
MTRLRISEILTALGGQDHLDSQRIERYRRTLDRLPPVVVFDTDEGLLLSDGYHRLAAASAEGQETIEADVRQGSRQDALEYAVAVGAVQRGMSPEEVKKHVLERHRGRGSSGCGVASGSETSSGPD